MKSLKKSFILVFCFATFFLPKLDADEELPLLESDVTISMDFQDANLKDVLKIFSIQSGLNFIASESLQDRKVTLYLDKVPIKEAMDKLFKANNLSYEAYPESNIIVVKDLGKPTVETITKVFRLKYATVTTSSLKTDMGALITNIDQISGGVQAGGVRKGKWKVDDNGGLTDIVRKVLSEYGWIIEDYRTNSLVITDIPSKMPIIEQTIVSLDVPIPQVLLEVEMLDVSKNITDNLGFDFTGTNPFTLILPGGGGEIGNKIFFGAAADRNRQGGITFGRTYAHLLNFLRTQRDTKSLARPRLLTLNNETAQIEITANAVIGLERNFDDQGNVTSITAERQDTGVVLRITPQINLEENEITMFIVPQVTEGVDSDFIGLGGDRFRDAERRRTMSLVKMKDGETIILGGLLRNESNSIVTKLPILGDIPIIGALFRHKNKTLERERELLVFITPRIMKAKSAELAKSKKIGFPEREQSPGSAYDRNAIINANLNNFEKLAR